MERKSAWKRYNEEQLNDLEQFATDYKEFISECKTERECVSRAVSMAKVCGFKNLQEVIARGEVLVPGDRVYSVQMGKQIMLAVIGREPIEKGMRIIGAHIDSPRMDIKQNPLYEAGKMAYMDTHYYGGIKKYQWVTLPLALHGIVCKKDKSAVSLSIGEDPEDPVFCVSDLLIHLAADQMSKPASQAIEGEKLDLLIAGRPKINVSLDKDSDSKDDKDKEKENVKNFVLDKLRDIGIDEADFQSAELEVVPAGPARDLGLDRSMILGYGHDDRSCAYPTLMALLHMDTPRFTSVGLLVDKEEIGSVGATGMHSKYFENMVAEMINCMTEYTDLKLRRALMNSKMLSCDVSAGYDPLYAAAFEKKNAAHMGCGVVFNKFTGSRGKSGSNDANAEFIADIRAALETAGVTYQTAELGRVDEGGGGTIAYIMANYGMQVIDCGVPVLSMHAPWEVINKADLYEAMRCYEAFLDM